MTKASLALRAKELSINSFRLSGQPLRALQSDLAASSYEVQYNNQG
jgi:hypothetical protein